VRRQAWGRGVFCGSNALRLQTGNPGLYTKAMNFRVYGFFLALAVSSLALSSISTLAAGLAWASISLAGLWVCVPKNQMATGGAETPIYQDAAKWWLWCCAMALALMLIPTAYWSGPWSERHPQWRLLIGALGMWMLVRKQRPANQMLETLACSAAMAMVLAYGLVIFLSSNAAPTNRIPWMAGLSLLSCALLSLSYGLKDSPMLLRRAWLAASALLLVTALLSGVRGSWPVVLVWISSLWMFHRSDKNLWGGSWRSVILLMTCLLVLGLSFIPKGDNPIVRFQAVVTETGLEIESPALQSGSSSGIRLTVYKTGIAHLWDSPWTGLGPQKTKQILREALVESGVAHDVVQTIGHLHNDFLHPWLEFGFWGLGGYLAYAVGLVVMVRKFTREFSGRIPAIGLLAVLCTHLATGMSNMNLAHNYYPVMLSISVGLILMMAQVTSIANLDSNKA